MLFKHEKSWKKTIIVYILSSSKRELQASHQQCFIYHSTPILISTGTKFSARPPLETALSAYDSTFESHLRSIY